jgi:hypothetical protein
MARRTLEFAYRWRFRCNAPPGTWRERLGDWLRDAADQIDRRYSLAIEISAQPPLDARTRGEIIRVGLRAMEVMVDQAARVAAIGALVASETEPPVTVAWGSDGD